MSTERITRVSMVIDAPDRGPVGTTLAGRYAVLGLLGAGGMGAVYRAHDRELDEMVALKVIRADHVTRPGMLEQFRHEVKLARRVTHVNIARTFELVVTGEMMFCTMELVEGESLRERLTRDGAMRIADAVGIASAVCDGLVVAHAAGVIHRDIKPENVLLTPGGRVVLADFGVAAFGAADDDGSLVGTLEYMAPEQARGEIATPATDVYAVGLLLFEMLTGLRAFSGTMSELIVAKQDVERMSLGGVDAVALENLPAELDAVVEKATERDPVARISSARELGRRLDPWLAMQSLATSPGIVDPVAVMKTVVVLAPRGAGGARLHIAEGVHQELLRRLAAGGQVRVWPRVDAIDVPNGTLVELLAGESLVVTIRREDVVSTLSVPLDIANVRFAADAIAAAVIEVIARESDPEVDARFELLLDARGLAHKGFEGALPAFELLKQGHQRWPDDARIGSELASLIVKYAFVAAVRPAFASVRRMVETALVHAPELAEVHVAAANLELHTGDPVLAAREYRLAIACSPYLAEPHEGLGRMLLEAGFLDDAMSRLDDALAIAPGLASARWEIARAHALEQNWMLSDQIVAELRLQDDRPLARLRHAMWRDDRPAMKEARVAWGSFSSAFEPELVDRVFSSTIDGMWSTHRDRVLELSGRPAAEGKRRLSFLAQVGAETAGYVGDVESCVLLLRRAVELDSFDRHWFDRCTTLVVARATVEGQRLQQIVTRRAEAILDALYGDCGSPSDTVVV